MAAAPMVVSKVDRVLALVPAGAICADAATVATRAPVQQQGRLRRANCVAGRNGMQAALIAIRQRDVGRCGRGDVHNHILADAAGAPARIGDVRGDGVTRAIGCRAERPVELPGCIIRRCEHERLRRAGLHFHPPAAGVNRALERHNARRDLLRGGQDVVARSIVGLPVSTITSIARSRT